MVLLLLVETNFRQRLTDLDVRLAFKDVYKFSRVNTAKITNS